MKVGSFEFSADQGDTTASGDVRVTIRPERVRLEPRETSGENRIPGMVERLVYLGAITQLIVRLAQGDIVQVMVPNQGGELPYEQGTPVSVFLPADALRILAAPPEIPA